MELNTPNRKQPSPSSEVEESPVFNYISNLSPLDLVKSAVHATDQTFNSLSFASPPSVFASPKLISHRDVKSLLKRRQFFETPKPESSKSKDDTNVATASEKEGGSEATGEQLASREEVNVAEKINDNLELATELLKRIENDGCNLDGSIVPHDAIRNKEVEKLDESYEVRSSYESEKHLRQICRIEQTEEAAGSDWVTLISNVADDLNFDLSMEEPQEQKMVDPGTISFISNVLQIPQDNASDLVNMESADCIGSSEQKSGEPGNHSRELKDENNARKFPVVLSSSALNDVTLSDTLAGADIKGKKCQSSSKHNRMRRLVFEMAMSSMCVPDGTSPTSPQPDSEITPVEKNLTPRISILPRKGIGLHLNALASTSGDGKVLKIETSSSTNQEMSLVLYNSENKVMDNAPQISESGPEDVSISSPKAKRFKLENVGASCKRCNCKRSKCLKLYCDCFAAGLYCIEPCSCQDCFNKPLHEATVLETRRQIESRNPLAFAPKVIRSADNIPDIGDESNKTPASARHKRGCNCKKSNCLKKYCECFQGGVGCSFNCRCEGCKNTFGTKNGYEELEGGESEALVKNKEDDDLELTDLSKRSEPIRSSIQLPRVFGGLLSRSLSAVGSSNQICSSQKLGTEAFRPPKFETNLQAIPEEESPDSNSSPVRVKSTSPNSKRVSPPHHGFGASGTWRSSRKLILKAVPSFPSLDSPNQK